jgi:hypothetical protein
VENSYREQTHAQDIVGLTQVQRDQLRENRKKNSKALFFIQQAMHDSIFPILDATTKSKEAWDVLQQTYQGTNKVKVVKLQSLRREFETLYMCWDLVTTNSSKDRFGSYYSGLVATK